MTHPFAGHDPAEGLAESVNRQKGHALASARRVRNVSNVPAMPCGKASTIRDDREPEKQPPEVCEGHEEVLDRVEDRRADPAVPSCLDAAQQRHHEKVDRHWDRDHGGIDRAFREGVEPPASPAAPPARVNPIQRSFSTSRPNRVALAALSRAALSA